MPEYSDITAVFAAYEAAHPEEVARINAWRALLRSWEATAPAPAETPVYWQVVVAVD
jgi:hypothetical protein